MTSDRKKVCPKCNTELGQGRVVDMQNNTEPYPQGSVREYVCHNCRYKFVEIGVTDTEFADSGITDSESN